MINFTTQAEYQGTNFDQLLGKGTEFCTFRQAVNYFNITGKELKGAKSCARLMKIVDKEIFCKITNKKIKKMVPYYFNVFEKNHLIETMKSNGHDIFSNKQEEENYDIASYYCNKLLGEERV